MSEGDYEVEVVDCPECGAAIETRWDKSGRGLLPGNYLLIADWVFHPECWDRLVERNPP